MNTNYPPRVTTDTGTVEGYTNRGLAVFKGIPYASPPMDELRWHAPRPARHWEGIRLCRTYGPSAPQNPSQAALFKEFVVDGPQSEDCLYLNIWSPGLYDARYPVMVWIHGGVFSMGSGSQSVFDGANLAVNQKVVVVTINYRLGLLGFLSLNEATGGRIPSTGNEGLLDQIEALKWIQHNITGFGGDPGNITLFGESAGGTSIECLMGMPEARGLFHKTIMQSNIHLFISTAQAADYSGLALQKLGVKANETDRIMQLPVNQLLETQNKLLSGGKRRRFNLAPVIDGVHLPRHPLETFRSGQDADVPLIIGTNLEESRLFQALRPDQKIDELLAATQTEFNFRQPAMEILEARRRHRREATFAYQFNWKSAALGGRLGACHGLEIGFLFGHHDENFCGSGPQADSLSVLMQQAWAAFARTGNPSHAASGEWYSYCPGRYIKIIR